VVVIQCAGLAVGEIRGKNGGGQMVLKKVGFAPFMAPFLPSFGQVYAHFWAGLCPFLRQMWGATTRESMGEFMLVLP